MHLVGPLADISRFVALRRDIHGHAELGFEDHRTSKIVADLLREWGIEDATDRVENGLRQLPRASRRPMAAPPT